MKAFANLVCLTVSIFMLSMASSSMAQDQGAPKLSTPRGDIALEIVGQVQNVPATPTSNQYGYLSAIDGIGTVFSAGTHNETTALFTFFTESHTDSVINNGKLRIVNRTGTTTIYLDEVPNGNFADPNTFRDGTPILTMTLRQQVILDLVENTFTTVNINTVVSASAFHLGGDAFQLGRDRNQFRTSINGRANDTGTPAQFVIAGYVVPIEDARP